MASARRPACAPASIRTSKAAARSSHRATRPPSAVTLRQTAALLVAVDIDGTGCAEHDRPAHRPLPDRAGAAEHQHAAVRPGRERARHSSIGIREIVRRARDRIGREPSGTARGGSERDGHQVVEQPAEVAAERHAVHRKTGHLLAISHPALQARSTHRAARMPGHHDPRARDDARVIADIDHLGDAFVPDRERGPERRSTGDDRAIEVTRRRSDGTHDHWSSDSIRGSGPRGTRAAGDQRTPAGASARSSHSNPPGHDLEQRWPASNARKVVRARRGAGSAALSIDRQQAPVARRIKAARQNLEEDALSQWRLVGMVSKSEVPVTSQPENQAQQQQS